jgi:hypothetical protein
MKHLQIMVFICFCAVTLWAGTMSAPPEVIQIVTKIQKADYEGDRAALKQLFDQLAPYAENKDFGSRVLYWRGFALWRRAINGFNEKPMDPRDLEQDLRTAIDEFQKAASKDPNFVDAKIGALSCMGYIVYLHHDDKERVQEFRAQAYAYADELKTVAANNPRFIWVMGPWLWNTPVEKGGGPDSAIASYKKGLEIIRTSKSVNTNQLEPSWGKPELLMSLSWSYANCPEPNLPASEENAQAALALVPYWHYVRDILVPQIEDAKVKAKGAGWK